jgi:Zn-dependent protease
MGMPDNALFVAIVAIGAILLSMTLHEAMHAYASYWLGDDTAKLQGRLSLNPLKHIDPVLTVALPVILALSGAPIFGAAKPVPFNPYRVKFQEFGAALVGLAGPLTNLVLAAAAAGILKLSGSGMNQLVTDIFLIFIQVNIGFFAFNMIPFPPLDGSRLLYAFAPAPLQRFMEQIEALGFMAIALFMFVLFPLIVPLLSSIMDNLLRFLLL